MNAIRAHEFACADASEFDTRGVQGASPGLSGVAPCGSRSAGHWYVFASKWRSARVRAELLAVDELVAQGFPAWCPMVRDRRFPHGHARPAEFVDVPFFPGYGFVRLDLARDPWGKVLNTRGVSALLCARPGVPAPVSDAAVAGIARRAADASVPELAEPVAVGDALRLRGGPFLDHEGVCLWSSAERVRLLVTLFGRRAAVTVARQMVARVG